MSNLLKEQTSSLPTKPLRPAPAKTGKSRRFFIFTLFGSWAAIAWTALTTALVGLGVGTLRFLFPNVLSEPPSKFEAGAVDNYEEGKVSAEFKERGVWIVRHQGVIYALSTICTHLGCTPNWLEREEKFKCPCHGSGFHITGVNFEGPAPRPLERFAVWIDENRHIVVDKSRKFQRELGQWTDPESYIPV
jgi:cytochrome b6-f complex iron-sulfur subunit